MLGECHAHVIMDGENYKEAVRRHHSGVEDWVIRNCFEKYRDAEITFVRDGGDCYGVSKRAKELSGEYGIDYRTPIFAIHKKGHYGGIVGCSFESIREYQKLVKEVRQSGGDFIKIMVSGLIDFSRYGTLSEPGLAAGEIKEMIAIAHEENMAVMVHCNGARTMEAAADAGADSIEHGAYSDRAALQAMVENQVLWTPTVSPIGNLKGGGRFDDQVTDDIKEGHLKMIKEFVDMGGRVALGSDAGAWRVPHVEGLHSELAYLCAVTDEKHLLETEKLVKKRFRRK